MPNNCAVCKRPCPNPAGRTFNNDNLCEDCVDHMIMSEDMKLTINSKETLSKAIGALRTEFNDHKYLRVSITSGKQRSIKMNALSHAWYAQVSDERGEMTPSEVKTFCKLHFGVPILRRDSEEFAKKYDECIKPMEYPHKLSVVSMLEITSAMTTKQMKEYLEEVQRHFIELPADSVVLEFPTE